MSQYVCLIPEDLDFNPLAFNTNREGKRELQAEYRSLRCEQCGKIDEAVALKKGRLFIEDFRPVHDIMETIDGLLLFSEKLWMLIQDEGLRGVSPIPILNVEDYRGVCFSDGYRVPHSSRGMKFVGKCSTCGRFREVKGMPPFEEMQIPRHEKLLFMPWPCNESPIGADPLLCTSKDTVKVLKKAKITGYQPW